MLKKIHIWWLGLLIDYHQEVMNETGFEKLEIARKYEAHRQKRNNLEARLTKAFYG